MSETDPEKMEGASTVPVQDDVKSGTKRRCARSRSYGLLAAVVLLVVVVVVTTVLVLRPSSSKSTSDTNYGWSSLSCPMFRGDVNFTVQFFNFQTGQLLLFVDDLTGGTYLPSMACGWNDPSCTTQVIATDEEHKIEGAEDGSFEIQYLYQYNVTVDANRRSFRVNFQSLIDDTAFHFDEEDMQLFLIRTDATSDGGLDVYTVDANIREAYNATMQAWDPCGFAYENEDVNTFLDEIAQDNEL